MKKYEKIFSLIVFTLFTACADTQSAVKKKGDPLLSMGALGEFGALDEGGSVYIAVDAKNARSLLELFGIGAMSGGQYRDMLDKTASAAIAFYPHGKGRRFLAVSRGEYPNALSALSVAGADWKKARAWNNVSYWRSDENEVSLALNSEWALLSDAEPFARSTGKVSPPKGFEDFRQGAILAGWAEDKGASLNRFLYLLEIPIELEPERFFFSVFKINEQYELNLLIETPSEEQAKGVTALFSLARLFIAQNSEADTPLAALSVHILANPAEQDGVFLKIRSSAMDAERMTFLFSAFLDFFTHFSAFSTNS